MTTTKESIENLEAKFMELQYQFSIMEVRVVDKLAKIEETINKLPKALLFDLVGKASHNHVLVPLKCHSRSVEKQNHNNFKGGLPLFDYQLAKLKFLRFCGDDPKVWSIKVGQFFDYRVIPHSQKVPLTFIHVEDEAN